MSRLLNDNMKERILKLAAEGKTNKEICFFVGITTRTLYNWQNWHPELKKSLQETKKFADQIVQEAIFQRAIGYSHPEEKVFYDSKNGQIITHKTKKHYPPDTGAGIFWLTNRDPEKWSDKKKLEHSGKIENLSNEELEAQIAERLKARKHNES